MRHQQLAVAAFVPQAQEHELHVFAQKGVERREGLVHEKQVRLHGDGAGKCQALLHAARKLAGPGLLEACETHALKCLERAAASLFLLDATHAEAKFGVLVHAHPRQQAIVLQDEGAVVARTHDALTVGEHLAFRGLSESRCQAQRCGLAAARRTDDAYRFTCLNAQRQVVERLERAGVAARGWVFDGDIPQFQ